MNPSATGWIKKLLRITISNTDFLNADKDTFYTALRSCGFIFGSNLSIVANIIEKHDLSEDEICKINLTIAFLYTHHNVNPKIGFVDSVLQFYTAINELKTSFFDGILGRKSSNVQLEKVIHKRIHIDHNALTKNFNYFIINALLFVDILAYKKFLKEGIISIDYIKQLEKAIEAIVLNAIDAKTKKNQYDESLIKLFESSIRYHDAKPLKYVSAIDLITTTLEKYYVLDLTCMASWSDRVIDTNETKFISKLGSDFNIVPYKTKESIAFVNSFYTKHKNEIALLSSKNIVQSFYDNSSKMVSKLISRNSKRLYKELKDSKELLILLTHSTHRELNQEEQKKVQEQLLDIFKSIPSLAIFILPGGALLLPLVIKFIPKLLPSAFDENRIED
ncbi:LETM1-related biofilm-associated protein [Aestuariivivens sp. NBU2969]|uniref:LETM1-related biofilm-associated protein n=1 Tax=Aestuariivivens sp. NBU2969 TaxID=2873267 RepID=UPI001CBE2D20|nr:LETM1-related biofilm-associated protein [Aestuariivivens sp. NBU2969]